MKVRQLESSSRWILTAVLCVSFASACAKPPPADFSLTGRPLSIDDPGALEVMAGHRDRARRSRAMRGLARVALEGPEFKLNRPQRIAIARPSKLRFEVLGLFDVLAAMLVSDGREFAFFEAGTGEVTRGQLTPELLWEFVQLDLEPDEIVGLLLGLPLPSPSTSLAGIWRESDAGITVVFSPIDAEGRADCGVPVGDDRRGAAGDPCRVDDFASGAEIFRFDAGGRLREMRSIDPGWSTRFSASFEDYRDSGSAEAETREPFPMRMTLHSPQVDAIARFEWKRIMLADELPDRLFTIPAGFRSGG